MFKKQVRSGREGVFSKRQAASARASCCGCCGASALGMELVRVTDTAMAMRATTSVQMVLATLETVGVKSMMKTKVMLRIATGQLRVATE